MQDYLGKIYFQKMQQLISLTPEDGQKRKTTCLRKHSKFMVEIGQESS